MTEVKNAIKTYNCLIYQLYSFNIIDIEKRIKERNDLDISSIFCDRICEELKDDFLREASDAGILFLSSQGIWRFTTT